MRTKNEHKPFWDEHTYFPEQWLESLAICTSNSCRILLGRSKCILCDVMPYDRRFCVETVGNRQAWIYCRLGMNFPISCTMLKWITSLWFVRTEEQDHFSSLSHRNPFQNFPWIRFFLFSEKLWQALPLPLRKGSWPLPKYKMLDFVCGLLMKKKEYFSLEDKHFHTLKIPVGAFIVPLPRKKLSPVASPSPLPVSTKDKN